MKYNTNQSRCLRRAAWTLGCVAYCLLAHLSANAQAQTQLTPDGELNERRVVVLRQTSIALLFPTLASQRLPVAFSGSLRKSPSIRTITLDEKDISLRELFDRISGEAPEYQWALQDGIVAVTANDELTSILDAELKDISYHELLFCDLEQRIIQLPEVAEQIKKVGFKPDYLDRSTPSNPLRTQGRVAPRQPDLVTLEYKSTTLRELLNSLLRNGFANSWSFAVDRVEKTISLRFSRNWPCPGD